MALKSSVWEVIKKLYCEQECSTLEIVKILNSQGIYVTQQAIHKKVKKNGWVKGGNKKVQEGEVVSSIKSEEKLLEQTRKQMNDAVSSLNEIVIEALSLKKDILQRTQKNLNDGLIEELRASKILANLGLGVFNIAKMLGISVEENLNKAREEKDVTNQIQIYLPNNGRT